MKTTLTLPGMILIMLCLGACRTSKLSNRQRNFLNAKEQTATRTIEQENKQASRISTFLDSNGHIYQLTIFPVDTFHFSQMNGFRGKASKIELIGDAREVKRVYDSLNFSNSLDKTIDIKAVREIQSKEMVASRAVEKVGFKWGWVFVIGGIFFGLWLGYKSGWIRMGFSNST